MNSEKTPGAGPSSCLAGDLTSAQRDLVIRHLPLQVSVIDEEGTLIFWHGDFYEDCDPRYIGRHVNECHSKNAQAIIARMDRAFREGAEQEAVFRRLESDRLVLDRYCSLRDAQGNYRGMMETMLDITDIRGMDGEKLALDW